MKTSKSPESAEVTPSKKKLKQARLPFKLISEVSPTPVTPPSRKRKLSATDVVSVHKVGKITKENDVEVVISDDDSKDEQTADNPGKVPNPYAKLVDAAIRKKQKSKVSKKKRNSRKKSEIKSNDADEYASLDCEMMEVDEPIGETDGADSTNESKLKQKETENVNKPIDIVVLEDSNSALDINKPDSEIGLQKDECKSHEDSLEISKQDNLQSDLKSDDVNKHNQSSNKTNQVDSNSLDIKTDQPEFTDTKTNAVKSNKKPDDFQSPDKKHNDVEPEKADIKIPITPKRSARNKAKAEENNNKGSPNSKLDESKGSDPTTPKSSSTTKLDDSLNESTTTVNLTPKQLQKKVESAKKKEKLEKEKQERERKRQEEKEERAKQRQEKEDLKRKEREEKEEAKKKEKEEKEELRKKEKEEKDKQKELEKKQKEEKEDMKRKEKEEKEEQRKKEKEAREEEKRKRQEALDLEKLEQEAKKKKAAEAFANFFVPKQKVEKDQTVGAIKNSMLSSFTIKSDMRLAPTTRIQLQDEEIKALEQLLKRQSVAEGKLYVKSLRNGVKPLSSGKTWPLSDMKDDDVIFVEDDLPPSDGAGEIITCDLAPRERLRPKLFSFHENRRPPYWGTWRKKSKFVKPRKPFGQDEKQLDYEVDSDDDWEEEAEGESLDGSAAGSEDEQDPIDEYEVDNEVFVPHGYLSDEEATMDEDDVLSLSPETQKARLKHLEDEFESEMKKPTEKLKPRLYGLLWENGDGGKPDNCVDAIWNYFGKLSMIMNDPTPLLQPSKEPEEMEKKKVKKKKSIAKDSEGEQTSKIDKKKRSKTVEEKEHKLAKGDKKNAQDAKKNQLGINMFLKKIHSS